MNPPDREGRACSGFVSCSCDMRTHSGCHICHKLREEHFPRSAHTGGEASIEEPDDDDADLLLARPYEPPQPAPQGGGGEGGLDAGQRDHLLSSLRAYVGVQPAGRIFDPLRAWINGLLATRDSQLAEKDARIKALEARLVDVRLHERAERDPAHDACRIVEQRLREANRRLQAEGPALERDKLIAAQSAEIERLKGEHERVVAGMLANAAGDCGACAEAVSCGGATIPHAEDCIVSLLKMWRARAATAEAALAQEKADHLEDNQSRREFLDRAYAAEQERDALRAKVESFTSTTIYRDLSTLRASHAELLAFVEGYLACRSLTRPEIEVLIARAKALKP